ncbi:N-acyl amino acid synthase FeeM domain-containing protein [Acidiphilium sp.]|uniref:N-acyl amino acid synthase FeeM domain-containing protein n=1 Tax=Acidiphilium sp. TaxID=527 RepID=UPI003D06A88F
MIPQSRGTSIKWRKPEVPVVEAQLAVSAELTEIGYRLRYEAYRHGGYIAEHPNRSFSDSYDEAGNSWTTVIFKQNEPAATVRVVRHDPDSSGCDRHELPAMAIFGDEIAAIMGTIRSSGKSPKIMEICRLARAPQFSKDLDVVFALFRTAGYLFLNFDADVVFNAVRSHHIPMYRRFGFQELEKPKPYPGLSCAMGLMASFRPGHAALIEGQPFLRGITTADAAYAGLIAGERVSIFGDQPAPIHQSGGAITAARQAG